MLKSLKLYNFQAHRKRLLTFDPGITTIKGRTDAGKSAILRALRWLMLNDMGGEDFISWGEREAVVILELEHNEIAAKVVRRKGPENVYKLNGNVFKAFGAGKVPDLIEEVLRVDEVNFQKQHDSPFWLGEKNAGEVSRQLNRVIDLSVIDTAISNASKMVRTARERVTLTEERLGDRRTKLTEAETGTNRIKRFKLLKGKYDEYEAIKKDHDQLEAILNLVDSCDLDSLDARARKAGELFEKASQLRDLQTRHTNLAKLIEDLELAEEWAVEVPDIGKLSAVWYDLKKVTAQHELLNELVKNIDAMEAAIEADEVELKVQMKKLMAVACPTCGSRRK